MEPQNPSEYFTPRELHQHLNMSLKWVEKQTQAHRIPGQTKIGRVWRYNKAEVYKALLTGQFLVKPDQRKRPAHA